MFWSLLILTVGSTHHTSILLLVTKFSSFKKTSLKQAFEIARITNFEVVIWSPKREKWPHSFSYAFFFFSLLVFQSLKHYSFCNFTEWKIHGFHLNDIISHIREKWLRQKKRVSRGIKSHYILVTKFSNLKEYLQYPTEMLVKCSAQSNHPIVVLWILYF